MDGLFADEEMDDEDDEGEHQNEDEDEDDTREEDDDGPFQIGAITFTVRVGDRSAQRRDSLFRSLAEGIRMFRLFIWHYVSR